MLNLLSNVAAGALWKAAAIGSLAAMLASSSYLGFQWHTAAAARDQAIHDLTIAIGERNAALTEVGELKAHIAQQNASILELAKATADADSRYATAMQALAPIKAGIKALAERINAIPSTTCEQAIAKQRRAVEGLREVQP
jgi:chromosome segregation ATPase